MIQAEEPTPTTANRRSIPWWLLAVVGICVGGALGYGASVLVFDSDSDSVNDVTRLELEDATTSATEHAADAEAFLQAWERYRNATFTATIVFERVTTNGQTLRLERTIAQKPPQRLVSQPDSVALTDGQGSQVCNEVNGQLICAPSPDGDYETDVAAEIAAWRTAFVGSTPIYVVSQPEPGCFQLDLSVILALPPYGKTTRLCFDSNGVLTKRQVVNDGATDTEEAIEVSTSVAPDAFAPPTTVPR